MQLCKWVMKIVHNQRKSHNAEIVFFHTVKKRTQKLCGNLLVSRLRCCRFMPHCVVFLSKTHESLPSTGSTSEDLSQHNRKIVDLDIKNQIEQTK